MNIDALLIERAKTHGNFANHAYITQKLKAVIMESFHDLSYSQAEALDMIAHKIGRIAGNPNHADHWDDIAGYATLISQQLAASQKPGCGS